MVFSNLSIRTAGARVASVNLTQYHPPIRRLQEEFAMRIARRKYASRGSAGNKGKVMDNSEPWLEKSNSLAEDWSIACKVTERIQQWNQPPPTHS